MDESPSGKQTITTQTQKRLGEEITESSRKRAKYTSAACNECKRCKVKCIRVDDGLSCQRCEGIQIPCIVNTTVQKSREKTKEKHEGFSDRRFEQLSDEIASLRQQVTALTATVESRMGLSPAQSSITDSTCRPRTRTPLPRSGQPREPQFVGPTRSAFSFNIAQTALNDMGISTDDHVNTTQSSNASSRETTPGHVPEVSEPSPYSGSDCLLSFSNAEIARLISVYRDEVISCHPIIDTEALLLKMPQILEFARSPNRSGSTTSDIDSRDVHMLRVVVATSITTEPQGKSEICAKLIAAVEQNVGIISSTSEVELKDIQIMAMLSIYFCHIEEELFAWRAIGRAARQCLEMGLHRRQSLVTHFKDQSARNFAVQVFWVVYELDRRWSFGTSLSFALDDRDIDAELPEPDGEHPYFKCMVTYARLCSRVWEALPPYGSPSQWIPKEKEDYLGFLTKNWLLSIPEEIQFRHPRLDVAAKSQIEPQSRSLHRLRTLCYLRGNYMRLLIHRHHVLNPDNVKADLQSARLVVDIAKDSIDVLVHFNRTSDIYARQQAIYHFYLLNALAIMLLAVCHAPGMFAEMCRESFGAAVELVKGFSKKSSAGRRLWRSVRGLLAVVKKLGGHGEGNVAASRIANGHDESTNQGPDAWQNGEVQNGVAVREVSELWTDDASFSASIPDVFDLSNDLMDLYNAFGSAGEAPLMQPGAATGNLNGHGWEMDEISGHLWGLI